MPQNLHRRLPLPILIVSATMAAAHASPLLAPPIDPMENFDNFGKQPNLTCPVSPEGICAAAAALNSFIFLENQYPKIYGNMLTPNIQGTKPNQTDPKDTLAFGNFYYGMTGGTFTSNYLTAKKTWIEDFAPGKTTYDSYFFGSPNHDGYPSLDFLLKELQDGEDVEFFVAGGGIAHALTLTGLTCTVTECIIKYQDPNSPTEQQTSQLFIGSSGDLQFQGLPGTGAPYLLNFFSIYAAFSESPIPEPSSAILFGAGIAFLITYRARRPR